MIDRLDTYDLNDKNTPYMVAKMASTINELVDESNRQGESIQGLAFAETPAEGTMSHYIKPLETPPEKEAKLIHRTANEIAKQRKLAVADFKKRIIKELKEDFSTPPESHKNDQYWRQYWYLRDNGLKNAIQIIEQSE